VWKLFRPEEPKGTRSLWWLRPRKHPLILDSIARILSGAVVTTMTRKQNKQLKQQNKLLSKDAPYVPRIIPDTSKTTFPLKKLGFFSKQEIQF
jgi:hypothetical protein